MDLSAAPADIFIVQGLMQVTDEVDEHFDSNLILFEKQESVACPLRVVGQGADDASSSLAIACIVDLALVMIRVVVGINKMKVPREAPLFCFFELVRPYGHLAEIVVVVITQ
jgi:hypothetical protein